MHEYYSELVRLYDEVIKYPTDDRALWDRLDFRNARYRDEMLALKSKLKYYQDIHKALQFPGVTRTWTTARTAEVGYGAFWRLVPRCVYEMWSANEQAQDWAFAKSKCIGMVEEGKKIPCHISASLVATCPPESHGKGLVPTLVLQ